VTSRRRLGLHLTALGSELTFKVEVCASNRKMQIPDVWPIVNLPDTLRKLSPRIYHLFVSIGTNKW
jgi:hypothetical protein